MLPWRCICIGIFICIGICGVLPSESPLLPELIVPMYIESCNVLVRARSAPLKGTGLACSAFADALPAKWSLEPSDLPESTAALSMLDTFDLAPDLSGVAVKRKLPWVFIMTHLEASAAWSQEDYTSKNHLRPYPPMDGRGHMPMEARSLPSLSSFLQPLSGRGESPFVFPAPSAPSAALPPTQGAFSAFAADSSRGLIYSSSYQPSGFRPTPDVPAPAEHTAFFAVSNPTSAPTHPLPLQVPPAKETSPLSPHNPTSHTLGASLDESRLFSSSKLAGSATASPHLGRRASKRTSELSKELEVMGIKDRYMNGTAATPAITITNPSTRTRRLSTSRHSGRRKSVASSPNTMGTSPPYPSTDPTDQVSSSLPNSSSTHTSKVYQCHVCGKIYKHPNCLTKHRWEHTEQWKEASKFSYTKHQQVQLLEAATILVGLGDPTIGQRHPLNNTIEPASVDDRFLSSATGRKRSTSAVLWAGPPPEWDSASRSPNAHPSLFRAGVHDDDDIDISIDEDDDEDDDNDNRHLRADSDDSDEIHPAGEMEMDWK
ncbi:uncharacterized protein BJ171DRAFT_615125 [Polychytrium aggregatum]|uniref:uncharacterized protein n=1 Tax=Polychytrium aggregatum TaxID=110093 RepID=UPI0022FDD1CE|nr:uncharacterized protein BJ171DRAFT_615125 [Polychytrium aggregatum]KAI9205667.1 hypothetical protein BJ171DRAFT_615125 [Polychytrium aggregatum]